MTFKDFQKWNVKRCEEVFHKVPVNQVRSSEEIWTVEDWCLAIAGECGELCNLVKKIRRGDFTLTEKRRELAEEIADIITYCDLAMSSLGLDTGEEVIQKFRKVSQRMYKTSKNGAD